MTLPFERLTIADVARLPRPGTVVPGRVAFTPDSQAVTYLFSGEGNLVRSLWRYDISTRERRVLAGPPESARDESQISREEELRRERARMREVGVTDYQFARKASPPVLLVPAGGRLLVSVGGEPLRELPGVEAAIDPRLSRDGRQVAFVRDSELWVAPTDGRRPARQLTSGAEHGLTNALADFIHQEELDQDRGFWWNPDGTTIAFVRADSRHIPEFPIVHQGKPGIDIERHRYPFAGDPNARLQLGVVSLETGGIVWMDLGPDLDIYLPRVQWRPDGVLTAQRLSRDQETLTLLEFDAAGNPTVLLEEHQEPWLNLSHDLRFFESGEFIWSSEHTGFRHLELHTADGSLVRKLTSGEWLVTHVVEIDEPRRIAWFSATKDSPLERHLYRVSLDGGEPERVTSEPGWHGCVLSPDGKRFIDIHSTMKSAPRVLLRDASTGIVEATLFADESATAANLGLRPPELLTLPAADGTTTLQAALYTPSHPPSGAKLPLVVSVYGGPHAQRVIDEWSMTVDLRAQYLAQQGFLVLKVDNRGSANRGLAFEAALDRRMGTVEVEDQAAAVRWLAANRANVDLDRVGVYGWSYGGYMTLMCMLREPDLFKVGVAGAPVTDWDGYDTGYTERYMGTPQSNPQGYRDGSVLTHAANLAGELFIVHGMIDENVHFRHTGRLLVALAAAQKEYELLAYPEERHMPRDQAGLEYQERRVLGFFEHHLR